MGIEHQLFVFVTCQFCQGNQDELWLKLLLKQYEPRERSEKRQRKEDISSYPFPGEGGYEVKMMVMD